MELNRVYLGDCLDLLPQIPDESIDLIVCDPPYSIKYKSGKWHGHYIKGRHHSIKKDIKPVLNDDHIVDFLPDARRVLKPDGALYVFGSDKSIEVWKPYISSYFKYRNTIVWVKNNHTTGSWKSQFRAKHEFVYYADKGKHPLRGHKSHSDVVYFNRVPDAKRLHPTEKPIDLCEYLIEKSSDPGDVVLDPFAGAGATLIAAKNTGRQFIGMEEDEGYVQICNTRLGL